MTSPRSSIRAAIWPVLIPGPAQRSSTVSPGRGAEHLDHRGRAAALRGERALGDQASAPSRRRGPRRPSPRATSSGQPPRGRRDVDALAAQPRHQVGARLRVGRPHRHLGGLVAGGEQRARRLGAELLPPHPRQPERRRVGDRGGLGGRVVAEQRRGQLARSRAARRRIALTKPDAWAALAILTSSTAWSTAAWSGVPSAKSSS